MEKLEKLIDAINDFDKDSIAILYSPGKCYLAIFDGEKFVDKDGEIFIEDVFEARVFNSQKEFRWLNQTDGKGKYVIISDETYPKSLEKLDQTYLLWGQSTGEKSVDGIWTQFAEARIGAFYVPNVSLDEEGYAHFTAVEYLQEFEDGNVAVVDERLTGILEVG